MVRSNLKFERVKLQPQKPDIHAPEMAQTTPSYTDPKTEKVQLQPEMENLPAEELEQEHAPPERKSKARKRRPRYYTAVRRSARVRNNVRPPQNQDIEPVQITLSESESESDKEEEPPQLEENVEEPVVSGEKTLVERVEHAVQLLEKMSGSQGNNRTSGSSEIRYRSLYIDSQKQIEALKKENHELSLNLQVALPNLKDMRKEVMHLWNGLENSKKCCWSQACQKLLKWLQLSSLKILKLLLLQKGRDEEKS